MMSEVIGEDRRKTKVTVFVRADNMESVRTCSEEHYFVTDSSFKKRLNFEDHSEVVGR